MPTDEHDIEIKGVLHIVSAIVAVCIVIAKFVAERYIIWVQWSS